MKLKKFTATAGGRFNPEAPIVIDFSKSKMVAVTGDQETGKTTLLDLFLMACGQLGGEKVVEALKNRDTDKIDLELSFTGNDRAEYEVKVTKSKFEVKRNGEVKGSPKDLLKSMLGVVGISPMPIKNGTIDEIVKWLASYSTRSAEEYEKDMLRIKEGQKKAKKTRAEANKEAKAAKVYLANEGIIDENGDIVEKEWKSREKQYASSPDIADLSKKLTAAGNKSDKFVENETKVGGQVSRKTQIEAQIASLQAELEQVDNNLEVGKKWLTENADAKKNYDAVKKQYDNAAQGVADYNKWQDIKKKKKEMDEWEELSIRADSKEKELVKEQQEIQWEVIPDIKGVEIILEDTHEEEGEQRKAGFYYNGFNSRQLSESEWFGLVVQILKKNKVQILVVDGAADLGSKFMDTLEKLVNAGCFVLYTEMERGQTELQIEYK